jgi:hypothetical protein
MNDFKKLGDMTFTVGTSLGIILYFTFLKPKVQNILNKIAGVEGVLPYPEGAQGNIELSRNYHLDINFRIKLDIGKIYKDKFEYAGIGYT